MKDNTVKLFEGDMRLQNLLIALEETIYNRAIGIPIPAILGTIELLKISIIEDSKCTAS